MEASRGRREGGGAAVSKKPSAAVAKSAYDDVFGGPPRFAGAATFAGAARMDDYAEIFGGLATSCSIPFLDLPPAGDGFGEPPPGGKVRGFDYSEVFGGFDFGEFASTYEELLAEPRREEAPGSSNGRAPMESSLRQQASEAFVPLKHRSGDPVPCLEDDQLSSNSNCSDGDLKQFNLSSNKLGSGLKEYAVHGITQISELRAAPRFSCKESNPLETEKSDISHSVPREEINDDMLQDKSHTFYGDGSRGSRDEVTTEWKPIDSQYPLPENDHASMKHHSRPSSSHSVSSGNISSSEIMYVSVSDINLQTQPSRVPPPSRPPPKMFNKQAHPIVKMNTNSKIDREGSSWKAISNQEKLASGFDSERPMGQGAVKESSPYSFDVEMDASSAATAAMKEAMELAEARLRSAKELMERKRDNFHSRKKMSHGANIKPKDMVSDQASAGRENLNPILMKKTMVNELKQNEVNFREEIKVQNTVKTSPDSKATGRMALAVEDEQMMFRNNLKSTKLCSGVEEDSEKWKVNKEYYELTNNEKKCSKVPEVYEQEASRNKIKETAMTSEENQIESIEPPAVQGFENNTQTFNDSEGSRKAENVASLGTDDIDYVEKRGRTTSAVVPDALLHENVINLEEICASHGEQDKKFEEVQGVHEAVDIPRCGESDPAFLKIGEKMEESMSQLNHDSIHVEGKSKVAKEFLGSGECSSECKGIYDSEDDESKSETSRREHVVDEVSSILHEVEETLDAAPRIPALDEKEIKVLDDSVKSEGVEDREPVYSFRETEKAEREDQVKSNQMENENCKEETATTLEQKDSRDMKQESSTLAENDCRSEMDQEQDYLEEVYKKLKAAQEAAMHEEQEKLMKTTKPTWKENNANGAQIECQQSVKLQKSTQAPSTLGNSKEPNVHQDNNEVTEDKDTREIHLEPNFFDKSPNLNAPQEVTEDKDSGEIHLKPNVFDKSPNSNMLQGFFPNPPNADVNVHQTNLLGRRSNIVGLTQDALEKQNISSEKCTRMNKVEDSAQLQTETEQADEQARNLEEEKEREREREKDRIAVERATREAHERALADARERAERIAVERVTAEARQRALKEAREKAELEKATKEARLRAERAAVERATAEARERAVERARAEMAAADAKDRAERSNNASKDRNGSHITQFQRTGSTINSQGYSGDGESALRCKARLERHQRTAERAAKALAEKNRRDILAQREQAERDRLAEHLDAEVKRWSTGKEGNLRALLSTLQYILGTDSGWQPIPLQEVVTAAAVKKAYRKSTLFVHPDKLQQRGASIQQKYICEKVFDLLKEAWNRFNSEER